MPLVSGIDALQLISSHAIIKYLIIEKDGRSINWALVVDTACYL